MDACKTWYPSDPAMQKRCLECSVSQSCAAACDTDPRDMRDGNDVLCDGYEPIGWPFPKD